MGDDEEFAQDIDEEEDVDNQEEEEDEQEGEVWSEKKNDIDYKLRHCLPPAPFFMFYSDS